VASGTRARDKPADGPNPFGGTPTGRATDPSPVTDRPVDDRPAHEVLADAGKRVLRPGGAALTREMVAALDVGPGDDAVEFAPGRGATAERVLAADPASYTGVELDADRAARLRADLGDDATVLAADAADTGLPADCADAVYGEAMLSMQAAEGKRAVVAEAARLCRPGGRYAVHELAVDPSLDEAARARVRDDLREATRVPAAPLPVPAWVDLLAGEGFAVEWRERRPFELLSPARLVADEGPLGAARVAANVLTDGPTRRRVREMRATLARHADDLTAVALLARRTETPPGRTRTT
jgi:SAM-dependent methyltransferase